jgi:tetratricopeptide (TPR) repeat protein
MMKKIYPMIGRRRTMKFSVSILLILSGMLLLCQTQIKAQSPEELMKKANKSYQEQNYSTAIDGYNKILSQGYESGTLFFNLGNAYFKDGRLGSAIYNYERGLKLSPNNEDLAYNLKIANARTFDKITEVPKLFIVAWWEGLVTMFGVSGWSIIVVVAFWILLASIAVYFFSRKNSFQRIAFMCGSISLSVMIVLIALLFARLTRETSANYGILIESTYSVKVTPDLKSKDAFVIHEGIKFKVEDSVGEWIRIRLIDGKIGWVQKSAVGQI